MHTDFPEDWIVVFEFPDCIRIYDVIRNSYVRVISKLSRRE